MIQDIINNYTINNKSQGRTDVLLQEREFDIKKLGVMDIW